MIMHRSSHLLRKTCF